VANYLIKDSKGTLLMLSILAAILAGFGGLAVLTTYAACVASHRSSEQEPEFVTGYIDSVDFPVTLSKHDSVDFNLVSDSFYEELEAELVAQLDEIRRRRMGRLGKLAQVTSS
jgi:hypothetical protein